VAPVDSSGIDGSFWANRSELPMRLCLLVLAASLLAPPSLFAEEAPVPDDGISTFELENGLQGIVIEDHRAPVVTHMVWYKIGAADDPPGLSGLAHFLEHMMFKGTESAEEGEFSRLVRDNGGEDNAFTSFDYTGYFQRIASDRLELVMEMEADRMANLAPPPASAVSELSVVTEERRQVVENQPGGIFNEQRRAVQFLNHPYGRPIIGWMHEIEALNLDAAMELYREHYAPNNAFVIVAGDVSAEEVRQLAETYYGPVPANDEVAERQRPAEPPQIAARRVIYEDPRVQNPYVIRTYLTEPRRNGNQEDAAALTVLAELLGSGITSVLSRELRVEEDFALDVGAFYASTSLDSTTFGIYVTPNPGTSLEEAEARMDAVVENFLRDGPDAEQLERIKVQLRASEIYARDNVGGRAREIGAALTSGLDLEDVRAWPGVLDAVTAEDVMEAARNVFRTEASVTGWLLGTSPSGGPAASGAEVEIGAE
jgi:zinc protease